MAERTPQQIIGDDAYTQLVFEGYVVTRPTPVAPVLPDATGKCGELVTVGWLWEYAQYRTEDRGYYGYETVITENSPADHVSPIEKVRNARELCLRSQAEELLAAERAENAYLKELVAARGETIKRGDDRIRKLEADNAAKEARIEELEANRDSWRRVSERLERDRARQSSEIGCLSAKLVATKKALEQLRSDCQEPIDMYERNGPEFTSPHGNEYESTSYVMAKCAEMVASIDEARAVLEAK